MLWTAMSVYDSKKEFAILPLNVGSKPSLVSIHALHPGFKGLEGRN